MLLKFQLLYHMKQKNKSILTLAFGTLMLITTYSACGQDFNSLSGDSSVGLSLKIDCANPANEQLCAAATGLQQKCFSCHKGWAQFTTSQDYIDAGLVVAGNSAGSEIVSRTTNAGGDMPTSGPSLSTTEYQALVDWIDAL
jgi:hypothetical protein